MQPIRWQPSCHTECIQSKHSTHISVECIKITAALPSHDAMSPYRSMRGKRPVKYSNGNEVIVMSVQYIMALKSAAADVLLGRGTEVTVKGFNKLTVLTSHWPTSDQIAALTSQEGAFSKNA
jgi:hypothetical protein